MKFCPFCKNYRKKTWGGKRIFIIISNLSSHLSLQFSKIKQSEFYLITSQGFLHSQFSLTKHPL